MIKSARVQMLLVLIVAIGVTVSAIWFLQKRFGYGTKESAVAPPQVDSTPISTETSSASPAQTSTVPPPSTDTDDFSALAPSPAPTASPQVLTLDPSYVGRLNLAVPVKGVNREQLLDTFKDARSEGRVHDAIDIPAPAGTPVIAAAEGEIIKLFESDRGGITIYQVSKDKKLIFYYAHLQGYADGLAVGKTVWQGETIGYVGDTGNAGAGNYHLHFSIMITNNPKRYWEGTNINPYPLLRRKP